MDAFRTDRRGSFAAPHVMDDRVARARDEARRALVTALDAPDADPAAVGVALERFVRHARDDGALAERVLVDLKALLAASRPGGRSYDAESDERRERLVRSAIVAYYRAD